MEVVDFVQCQKIVLALLDAGPDDFSFSVNVGDERFGALGSPSDQVKEALQSWDERVYVAIAETIGHWARPALMDWSSLLAHLDEIPDHIGDVGDVQILPAVGETYVAGQPASVAEIREWRRSKDGAFGSLAHNAVKNAIGGYFEIRDNVIHFTGHQAAVKIISPYVRNSNACQSPRVYQIVVWVGALSLLFAKLQLAKASFLAVQAERMIAEIRGNLTVAPVLEQYKEARG